MEKGKSKNLYEEGLKILAEHINLNDVPLYRNSATGKIGLGEDWMYEEYNGHPTWFHWSIINCWGSDPGFYGIAKDEDREGFIRFAEKCNIFTADGAVVNRDLAGYYWDHVHEDDEQDKEEKKQ